MVTLAPATQSTRLVQWAVFVAGICVACPFNILPGLGDGRSPRLPDVLNLVGALLLALSLLRNGRLHRSALLVLVVWGLSFTWLCAEAYYSPIAPDPPAQRILLRWFLSGFAAYWIILAMENAAARTWILAGMLVGVLLSLSTVLYDYETFVPENMPIDELVKLAIYNGKDLHDFIYRASGVFGHPNGAAGCVLIGVPILLGMIEEKKLPAASVILGVGLMAGTFYLTKSRGSLMVAIALIAIWVVFCAPTLWRLAALSSGLVAAILAIAFFTVIDASGSPLVARFLDFNSITENADDRWWTIATSVDLILRHPFGMGSAYGIPLSVATGTDATHNAYLELALMGGWPLTIFVVWRLARTASLLFKGSLQVEAWLAAYLVGIFFFETYFVQVNIPIIVTWLLWPPARMPHGVPPSRHAFAAAGKARFPTAFGAAPTPQGH